MAFCPNCGTQQPDGTPTCTKCNAPLTGDAAAPGKFKGTIMMGGTSAADVDAMVQKAKSAAAQTGGRVAAPAPSRPAPVPSSVAPAVAAAAAAAGAPAADEDALAYQATIMGPITSPSGSGPAAFPHPLFGGGGDAAAPGSDAESSEDPIHSAPTMGFEPTGEGGPTIVDGGAPEAMAAITDDRVSLPVRGGKGGLILVLIIVGVLALAGIGIGAFFWFRTPDVPQYPGYPMPGQVMPGQVPGQIPGYPMPGQMPAPGQMPGFPAPPPAQ